MVDKYEEREVVVVVVCRILVLCVEAAVGK